MLSYPESVTQTTELTVSELIEILQQFPPDALACVQGYEGGFTGVKQIECKELLLKVNDEWHYYGPHDDIDSVCDPETYQKRLAVIITRRK